MMSSLNFKDLSDEINFQFEFFCSSCRASCVSKKYPFKIGWSESFNQSSNELAGKYFECKTCSNMVCNSCFNPKTYICNQCQQDINIDKENTKNHLEDDNHSSQRKIIDFDLKVKYQCPQCGIINNKKRCLNCGNPAKLKILCPECDVYLNENLTTYSCPNCQFIIEKQTLFEMFPDLIK